MTKTQQIFVLLVFAALVFLTDFAKPAHAYSNYPICTTRCYWIGNTQYCRTSCY